MPFFLLVRRDSDGARPPAKPALPARASLGRLNAACLHAVQAKPTSDGTLVARPRAELSRA